jgi:Tol biopolymer transport system component
MAAQGRVVFTIGGFDGPRGIAAVNADGSDFRTIAAAVDTGGQPHGGTQSPRWTADGRIVFSSNRAGGPDDWHIFIVGADGGDTQQLTSGDDGIEYDGVLSPDGSTLLYAKALANPQGPAPFNGGGIFASDADGGRERQLAAVPQGTSPEYPDGAADELPDISPDGKRVAFTRAFTDEGGLFVVDTDGKGLRRIIDADFQATRPRWSPDGQWILFHSNADRFATESSNLWLVRPDGSDLRQLTYESEPGQAWAGDWSPAGDYVVYVHTTRNRATALDVAALDGTLTCTLYRASGTDAGWDPDWGPATVSGS